MGFEPTSQDWQSRILPLYDTRMRRSLRPGSRTLASYHYVAVYLPDTQRAPSLDNNFSSLRWQGNSWLRLWGRRIRLHIIGEPAPPQLGRDALPQPAPLWQPKKPGMREPGQIGVRQVGDTHPLVLAEGDYRSTVSRHEHHYNLGTRI